MRIITLVTLVATLSLTPRAWGDEKGWAGESCRARADCQEGLRCINNQCRSTHEGANCKEDSNCPDKLVCRELRCMPRYVDTQPPGESTSGATGGETTGDAGDDDQDFLDETRLFLGLSLGAGFTNWKVDNYSDPNVPGLEDPRDISMTRAAVLLAGLHIGALINHFELSLEIAPVTWWPVISSGSFQRDPVLSGIFNFGYFIPLKDDFYWPVRLGAGLMTVNVKRLNASDASTMFIARLQGIGGAYRIGPVMLEMDLPALRWASDFDESHLLSVVFEFRALYMF